MNYQNYQKGRSQIKVLKGECSLCKSNINLQVHHLSYKPEIFVILCKKCHERIHKHTTGSVQKSTKYGYEDFRNEHKEEIDEVRRDAERIILASSILRNGILNDVLSMKILYGFGNIREKKEVLEQYLKEIRFTYQIMREGEEKWNKERLR